MTTIGLLQPITTTLPPKPVVTSSKKMTILGKAVAWFNSPAGFEKATRTLAAAATLAGVAVVVYYLNQNNFFGSTEQANPNPKNEGGNTSYTENCDLFGMCVTDQTCQPNPPGYGDTQNWETCSKFASGPKSEPNNEKTTTTNKPESNSTKTDSSHSTKTSQPFIPPTCPVDTRGNSTITLPKQPFSPLLNITKIVPTLVAHNNQSNITANTSTNSVAGETIHTLPSSISEPFTQDPEVFEPSKFCQSANSLQVAAVCQGILNNHVVFDPYSKSAFPNLREALSHIYQSANNTLHDLVCNATRTFWANDSHIYLSTPVIVSEPKWVFFSEDVVKNSVPVSSLLDNRVEKRPGEDFNDMHQIHKNICGPKNSN